MTQSNLHVAIIMDGNGRWARARDRRRSSGHLAGAEAVRRVVEAAPGLGVTALTLYAFSSDNWRRPAAEVAALLKLFERFLRREAAELAGRGVRLRIVGRRDRLTPGLRVAVAAAEAATAGGTALDLRIAIDYSARDAVLEAAMRLRQLPHGPVDRARFARLMGEVLHQDEPIPDVDLLIRTGGEQRLSDFMLWECAYAELAFHWKMWPDWTAADLAAMVADFRQRDRRFGGLSAAS